MHSAIEAMGEYTRIKTGKLDANASSVDGAYPFFTCSKEPLKIDSYSYECECVLIAGNGDLNVKYYSGKFDAYQRTYIVESVDKGKLDTKYLYYFLDKYVDTLREQSIGGVIKYIKLGFLTEARIPVPSLAEQRRIVDILNKANAIISDRKWQLELLDIMVKSRFVEMFGDPVTNDKDWDTQSLTVITSKIGSGATPRGGKESYIAEGISLIRSMNVHNGFFKYSDLAHITKQQAAQLDIVTIRSGDVLLNITGASVARCCVVPDDVLPARVNQHVSIIRCKPNNAIPVFVNHVLISDSYQQKLLEIGESGGATRQAITKQQIEGMEIIVPPLPLQNRFADFVRQADKSKFNASLRVLSGFCGLNGHVGIKWA